MKKITQIAKSFLLLAVLAACNSGSLNDDAAILSSERFPSPIALTQTDIDWFRGSGVAWVFAESGAPAIIVPTLSLEAHGQLYEGDEAARLTLRKFERVFMSFAVYARLKAGRYSINPKQIVGDMPAGLSSRTEFELTQEHIDLIRNAWWRHAYIDFKYPYGSYRYYEAEMALKLGKDVAKNRATGEFELSESDEKKYQILHKELMFVLQAFVQHAEIEPGKYQLPVDGWSSSFVRLAPPSEAQVASYIENAVSLKRKFSNGQGDKVIDWMKLNERFSEIED